MTTSDDNQRHAAAMAGVHDSITCALGSDGGPCDWCRDINEREQEGRINPVTAIDIINETVEHGHYASLATVRCAIADVLDEGWRCAPSCDLWHPWTFPTEMFLGDAMPTDKDLLLREKFLDTVVQRITQLQSPLHQMDAGLQAFGTKG